MPQILPMDLKMYLTQNIPLIHEPWHRVMSRDNNKKQRILLLVIAFKSERYIIRYIIACVFWIVKMDRLDQTHVE